MPARERRLLSRRLSAREFIRSKIKTLEKSPCNWSCSYFFKRILRYFEEVDKKSSAGFIEVNAEFFFSRCFLRNLTNYKNRQKNSKCATFFRINLIWRDDCSLKNIQKDLKNNRLTYETHTDYRRNARIVSANSLSKIEMRDRRDFKTAFEAGWNFSDLTRSRD